MMILTFFLIIFSFLFIVCYFMRIPSYRTYKLAQKLPGENKFSIFGAAWDIAQQDMKTLIPHLMRKAEEYGKLSRFWFLGIPMVFVRHPDYVKEILGNDRNVKKGWEYDYFHDWAGPLSVFTTVGDQWKERRAILNTPLNFKITDKIDCFNKYAKKMVEKIIEDNQEETDVLAMTSYFSLSNSCEALMGVEIDQESVEGKKYVKSLKYVLESVCFRIMNGIYMKDWMFRLTPLGRNYNYYSNINYEYTKKVIHERMKIYSDKRKNKEKDVTDLGTKTSKPITDSIIENGALYGSEEQIIKETNCVFFAAHDTNAVTLLFVIFCLANNKEVQEKVFKEQESIFGTSKRDATGQDVNKMTYLLQVIRESMRIYPTVPYLSRELQEDVKCDDLLIPKGSNIMIMPMVLHHNAELYPEPKKFDPERFSPENCKKRHLYSYIPFSGGPRICPGQKYAETTLKVFLSTLIRNFEIHPITTPEELVLKLSIVLLPDKPIKVKFVPRN